MAKSDRQLRAEKIAERFRSDARRSIVLEFAGIPKAGKTSTISQLQSFLKRCGFRVQVVIERASVCPIRDKKHFTFNVWTACTTLAQILENTQDPPRPEDPQILILDRGLFDAVCWLTMMDRLSRIRSSERLDLEKFLLMDEWRKRITGVLVMTASPEDSMSRERGLLPVEATGSIMNHEVLTQMLVTTKECIERMKNSFHIHEINTTGGTSTPLRTAEQVADIVMDMIEGELREDILHLPKQTITDHFGGNVSLNRNDAQRLLEMFIKTGKFRPRQEVEEDLGVVQALPVVVVRNKSGAVLRLRRREKNAANPLHEKIVIWAGGHVRTEDGVNGNAVIHGALRELQEELRLNVEPNELRLLGAIYIDSGNGSSKHVAIVFEWQADTDDVAVTLSSAEFFERRGTSLSGKFVSLEELSTDLVGKRITETWSSEIIRSLLPDSPKNLPIELF
jgi:predicted NUDIX family phosphoesterase